MLSYAGVHVGLSHFYKAPFSHALRCVAAAARIAQSSDKLLSRGNSSRVLSVCTDYNNRIPVQ